MHSCVFMSATCSLHFFFFKPPLIRSTSSAKEWSDNVSHESRGPNFAQLSQPLYTDTKREHSLYTHVHVCQAQKQRRWITHIVHVWQLSNNYLCMQHMHKNIHPHRDTHFLIHLITYSRHVYPSALAFRVLISCSQTAIYRSHVVKELLGHGLQRAGWSLG